MALTFDNFYRTDDQGQRQKLKGITYDRPVRTASGFDYALGQAVARIMGDDDRGLMLRLLLYLRFSG